MKDAKHKIVSIDEQGPHWHISYPGYRSCDEFFDVQRLRSPDGYLARRIERYINTKADDPNLIATGEISLTTLPAGAPYHFRGQRTEEASEFTMLMEFVETLPFRSIGRIAITYRDHLATWNHSPEQAEISGDFIWFQTNLRKRFFVKSEQTGEKLYIDSYSAWFDTVNQHLGSDVSDSLAFSFKVDGQFTDKFRRELAVPTTDLNSKQSLVEELSR